MTVHTVLGAGAVGRSAATSLAVAGHHVRLVSRSGAGPHIEGVERVAADVTDPDALARVARGTASITNALNPAAYTSWERDWPPMAGAILDAAARSGAGLVTVAPLYAYGRVDRPITPETPLRPVGTKGRVRAAMWEDAISAHEAGRVRACEVRASDYSGASATGTSFLNDFVVQPTRRGRTVRLPMGDPDALHTWTSADDTGRFAARLATDDRSWGRAWHVPSPEPRSIRQVVMDVAELVDGPVPAIRRAPWGVVRAAGLVVPVLRELAEVRHEFEAPWVLDDTASRETFGVEPTPWEIVLTETVDALAAAGGGPGVPDQRAARA